MEGKPGLTSRLSGLVRVVIAVLLVLLLVIIVVRWNKGRQAEREARDATTSTQSAEQRGADNPDSAGPDESTDENSDSGGVPVPSGIADRPSDRGAVASVPSVGPDFSVLMTAVMLGAISYLSLRLRSTQL